MSILYGRKNLFPVSLTILLTVMVAHRAAALSAGDRVNIAWRTAGGGQINGTMLKGHLLVVDFWATWCHPCMMEAPTVVKDYNIFSKKGVGFVGISLDNDPTEMLRVAKRKGIVWPQVCNGAAWQDPTATAWGVRSIPDTFIVSPNCKILWTGYPTGLSAALTRELKAHPTMVLLMKQTRTLLASATKKVRDNQNISGAMKDIKNINSQIGRERTLRQPVRGLLMAIRQQGVKAVRQVRANHSAMRTLARLAGMGRVQTWLGPIK